MTKRSDSMRKICRRALLATAGCLALILTAPTAFAQKVSGEIVLIDWLAGSDLDTQHALEAGFEKAYPGTKVREINLTTQGDQRGAIRAALMSGEKADLLINSWPAFRAELAEAKLLRPLDQTWEANGWSQDLADAWRKLGQTGGVTYGLTYGFGDRSGLFYRTETLKKAGITAPPATWTEFLASFAKLNAAGVTPVAMPGKTWAHADWFESLLVRTAGVEVAAKLARHEIPWTDPAVKTAFKAFADMLKAKCCGEPSKMLGTEWDNAADDVFKAETHGYVLLGTWINARAKAEYGLKEGTDYGIFQVPAFGLGHDDTSIVDTRELLSLTSGGNPAAADAFLGWVVGPDAAAILAKGGMLSPSAKADTSQYGPVASASLKAVMSSKLQFVVGDLLPGDLVDEYRVQIQRFLQDPSDATIDAVTAALEAKAQADY